MRFEWAATLLVSTFGLSLSLAAAADDVVDDHGVLQWINATKGGFVHPGQAFQVDPEFGVTGIFATQDIKKGSILMQVPWSIIIKSDDPDEEGQMCCGTVDSVAREMKKGDESDFAPYANYLNAQSDDQIPSTWSPLGQKLMREIVGGDLREPFIPPAEPTEWLAWDWYKYCRGSRADKISAKAAIMVVQRSDDTLMIPGYDMYNHRNGDFFNTVTNTVRGKHLTVEARRNIKAGEQIHNSYNKCKECMGRRVGYGSAEILRDYGFLEPMPQRWHYLDQSAQFDLNVNMDGNYQLTWSRRQIPRKDDRSGIIVWFDRQIRRLRQVRNIDYKDGNPGMPESEWDLLWDFQKANIVAMTVAKEAVQAIENGNADENQLIAPESTFNTSSFDTYEHHYDGLAWEFDDLDYAAPTCGNTEIMKFHDHYVVDEIKTQYQNLNFGIHPGTGDVVMDLDNIVQISSNYRPQYHEPFVHGSARFVESIKRVIFIGGGDSMLLHEVLKYPDLELVVGLELDQMVVRKSFKYFKSQPHFDDPRVEWWFGDATKSLLLLSKEYWQSFDLVLVDLSETVMSFSVTAELDVFDALALLLRHEGIMVKNELYMEPMSKTFDNTLAILYDSPVICSQMLIFGSNKVDFMHDEVYDHGVHTLLYKDMHLPNTRHDLLHDYRVNDARRAGKCGDLPEIKKLDEQFKSAGVANIIEAERTSATLDASIGDTFLDVIKREGFNPVSAPIYEDGQLFIIMQEGYVIARMFPSEKYCNIDVNLWGSFHKLKELSQSLTDALGSERVSKFRVVVGGMYGSKTWKEDSEIIGPQIVKTRNCDVEEHNEIPEISEELITAAFEAAIPLVDAKEITAVVLCENSDDCLATKLLNSVEGIRKVVGISACSSLKADDSSSQYDCEISKMKELEEGLGSDKADLLIVDGSSPLELVQVMNSILSRDRTRISIVKKKNVFMAWSANPEEEDYHKNFLERFVKQHEVDPIGRAEFWMQAGKKAVEFGVVITEDRQVGYTMEAVEMKMQEAFKANKDVKIKLRGIYGGLFEYKHNFVPNEFLQSDYDDKPGYEQYYEQKPFAHHSIIQVEEAQGKTFNFSKENLNMVLFQSLKYNEFKCTTKYSFGDGLGEGIVFLCLNPEKGTVVMSWDGRKHVDISYYLSGNAEGKADKFIASFMHYSDRSLTIALRDNMPRGTGRVINFEKDMMTPEEVKDFYENMAKRKAEADAAEEDEEDEEDDEEDFDSSRSEL